LKSIAFPALATGVARFPADRCAEVMIAAARGYGAEHPDSSIELVVFVLFTLDDYGTFKQFADQRSEQ
jgi:O-acetyl-ADP-ribose deacetylase (regulator of RNase III)